MVARGAAEMDALVGGVGGVCPGECSEGRERGRVGDLEGGDRRAVSFSEGEGPRQLH